MLELHPEFLTKNGKREFAVIPYEEFEVILDLLANFQDLRNAKAQEEDQDSAIEIPILDQIKIKTPVEKGWKPGFFEEVIGGWGGESLVREELEDLF